MSEENKFNEKDFQVAVEALNGYLKKQGKEEIVIEGLSIEDQVGVFLGPVTEAIDTGVAGELPTEVIDFYNNQLAEDDEPEEAPEEPKKGKKDKPKKEKKERKPSKVEKDAYGCTVSSGASKINSLIEKGQYKSIKELIELVGTTRSRIQSHFGSLKTKGFFIDNVDGTFSLMTEEPPARPKVEKPKKEKTEKPKTEKAPKKKTSEKETPKKKKSTKKGK